MKKYSLFAIVGKALSYLKSGARGFFVKMLHAAKEIFGQFLTLQFWKDLLKIVVQEGLFAFIERLGRATAHYGQQQSNPNLRTAPSGYYNNNVNDAVRRDPSLAEKAFGITKPVDNYQGTQNNGQPFSSVDEQGRTVYHNSTAPDMSKIKERYGFR